MKIHLPGFVIADLYKDTLVEIKDMTAELNLPKPKKQTETPKPQQQWFMGDNKKHICILVKDENNVYIDDENLQMLSNLLAALQLNLGDVAIVNFAKTPLAYNQISERLQPRVCLLFNLDTEAIQLPFVIPSYQVQQYNNCKFLQAASLDVMKGAGNAAKVEKTKLWVCLKTIFEIK